MPARAARAACPSVPLLGLPTLSLLQVYHLPGSTNIWWPPTSMMAYVSGAGVLTGDGWYFFCEVLASAVAAHSTPVKLHLAVNLRSSKGPTLHCPCHRKAATATSHLPAAWQTTRCCVGRATDCLRLTRLHGTLLAAVKAVGLLPARARLCCKAAMVDYARGMPRLCYSTLFNTTEPSMPVRGRH